MNETEQKISLVYLNSHPELRSYNQFLIKIMIVIIFFSNLNFFETLLLVLGPISKSFLFLFSGFGSDFFYDFFYFGINIGLFNLNRI